MDGASKFVKGDAIAGIIIVLINLIFGIIIGMVQQGMTLGDAASHFSQLTVGDGIVSQIPALIISTATGIVVTRAASDGNLGQDITPITRLSEDALCYWWNDFLLGLFTPINDILTIPIAGLLIFGGFRFTHVPETG